jgi:hypothetical protein
MRLVARAVWREVWRQLAMTDEALAALLRRAVYEGVRDALRLAEDDQGVPSAGTAKEEKCRDQRTNERASSGRTGTRVGSNGGSSRSTRRQPLEQKIDRALSIIQQKMKRTKQSGD